MATIITNELIENYIKRNSRHSAYDITTDIAEHLKFHIDGYTRDYNEVVTSKNKRENKYFMKLIDTMRPSESEIIKNYRRSIYIGKTKAPCFRVINSLKKIVKSPEWDISFDNSEQPPSIAKDETIEEYTEEKYPFFNNIESWLVNYAMKEVLSDPNSLIAVLPIKYNVEQTEYVKPYAYVIDSANVFEYKEGEIAVFRTNEQREYRGSDGKTIYKEYVTLTVTTTEIFESVKVSTRGDYQHTKVYDLTWGELPVFRSGGIYKTIVDNAPVYNSLIDAMLPGLDTAARECSDLDAEVVQHVYSQMWYYSGKDCNTCNGSGKVQLKKGGQSVCGTCNGEGVMAKSPYKDIVIKAPQTALGEAAVPTPPAGYVQKNIEIVKIQDERIRQHISDALSAINMEFLNASPLAQSGIAKAFDRDELNNFVYGVAYHFVQILNNVYRHTINYRYVTIMPDKEKRLKMSPYIYVPTQFDLLTANMLSLEIKQAKESKQSPMIISELEVEYAEKAFSDDEYVVHKMKAINELDPFIGYDNTEKQDLLLAGEIDSLDYIVSVYLPAFLEQLSNEDKNFYKLDYKTKKEKVYALGKDKQTAMKSNKKVITDSKGNPVA